MQEYTDILLDSNGDLFTETGDAMGNCRWQDIWQLLRMTRGSLTFAPWIGCDLVRFVQNTTTNLKQHVKLCMRKANIEISNNEIDYIINKVTK